MNADGSVELTVTLDDGRDGWSVTFTPLGQGRWSLQTAPAVISGHTLVLSEPQVAALAFLLRHFTEPREQG